MFLICQSTPSNHIVFAITSSLLANHHMTSLSIASANAAGNGSKTRERKCSAHGNVTESGGWNIRIRLTGNHRSQSSASTVGNHFRHTMLMIDSSAAEPVIWHIGQRKECAMQLRIFPSPQSRIELLYLPFRVMYVLDKEDIMESKVYCRNCGKPLPTDNKRKKVFCSMECDRTWWLLHQDHMNRKSQITVICKYCGKPFKAYEADERQFCSVKCFRRYLRKDSPKMIEKEKSLKWQIAVTCYLLRNLVDEYERLFG